VRRLRYADTVFMAPPWREIFHEDAERRHGFAEAEAEYRALVDAYRALGYTLVELPRSDVETRVRFVTQRLPAPQASSAIERVS
jgi:predicted ATPase